MTSEMATPGAEQVIRWMEEGQKVFEGVPQQIDDAQFKAIYGQEAERISVV